MIDLLKQLDEMALLAEAATEGPWTQWVEHGSIFYGTPEKNTPAQYGGANVRICECEDERDEWEEDEPAPANEENAAFIAAARNFLTPATLDTLRALVAASPERPATESQWVAVSERLPEEIQDSNGNSRRVLIAIGPTDDDVWEAVFDFRCKEWVIEGDYLEEEVATHWMPLPSPPVAPTGPASHE